MPTSTLRRSARILSASCSSAVSTASMHRNATTVANIVKEELISEVAGKPAKRPRKRARIPLASEDTESAAGSSEAVVEPEVKTKASRKRKEVREPVPEDFSTRTVNAWKIGPHVSVAGGVENAITNAAAVGANAFALFLKSQRKWESSAIKAESILAFKSRMKTFGYSPDHILPHGSYLVNLGNPDEKKREQSYTCFLDDLKRCEELGLRLYNFHPGSTVGQTTTEHSCSLIAACINRAHKETENAVIVLENMAGSGNVVGSRFLEIGAIIREVENKSRIGVCLDTCHMFAAGYDVRTKEGWDATMAEFEQEVGLKYLRGMHINDSKVELGSKKDRHQNIGQGHLTLSAFAIILTDPRTRNIPLILETPLYDSPGTETEMSNWSKEVEVLNRFADGQQRDEATLREWEAEIGAVVKRSSTAKEAADSKKRKAAAEDGGKRKRAKKGKKAEEDDEDSHSCDDHDE